MFNLSNHKTEAKHLGRIAYEIAVITPDNIKFVLQINSAQSPKHTDIINIFKEHYKHFFIELDVLQIVQDFPCMALIKLSTTSILKG